MAKQFFTKALDAVASLEMFDWLDERRSAVKSIEFEHADSAMIADLVRDYWEIYGLLDGPWMVVLDTCEDDLIYFMMKWC